MSIYGETLTLYRGDNSKIEEFDFHKTSRYCMVGAGIYLTTSKAVADSYRTKGHTFKVGQRAPNDLLFSGQAKDRTEAYAKAFETFLKNEVWPDIWNLKIDKRNKVMEKRRPVLWEEFRKLIADGLVVATYTNAFVKGSPGRTLDVVYTGGPKETIGVVTQFEFDRSFLKSVVPIDQRIDDSMFWEIMHDKGQIFGTPYASRDEFIYHNLRGTSRHIDAAIQRPNYARIRAAIQPYGYLGFEYRGGAYVGGYGRHRAFCLWDDEFVNKHRVKLIY